MDNTCFCGSKKILELPLSVTGSSAGGPIFGTADLSVSGAPQAWVFKDEALGGLTARVCCECGHVELHAKNFRMLYEKHEKAQQEQDS